MDAKRQNEDSEETKENEGVDKDSPPIGGEAAKFDGTGVPGYLEQEARGEEYEEH